MCKSVRSFYKSVCMVYKLCSQIHNLFPQICKPCPRIQSICFFREQVQFIQVSPVYRDLRVDLMLYRVLHWTFHSFHCLPGSVFRYVSLRSVVWAFPPVSEIDVCCDSAPLGSVSLPVHQQPGGSASDSTLQSSSLHPAWNLCCFQNMASYH